MPFTSIPSRRIASHRIASTDSRSRFVTQGAALARAVLESLLSSGACVLASTHSDALKKLGLADERIAVGAMAMAADGAAALPALSPCRSPLPAGVDCVASIR